MGARRPSFLPTSGARRVASRQQARVAHIAEQDDFGLLLRYGADCIGAVGVRRLAGGTADDAATVNELTANPGRTVSGIQRKLLVVKDEAETSSVRLDPLDSHPTSPSSIRAPQHAGAERGLEPPLERGSAWR